MDFEVGKQVWLPCEVKPGPFSDELMVRVQTGNSDWLGFVPISALSDITQGKTFIRAVITSIQGDAFTARLPGHAISSSIFQGTISGVKSRGSLQA